MAKVAKWTLTYYTATTAAAVVLGIALVSLLQPGRGSPLSGSQVSGCGPDQVCFIGITCTQTCYVIKD